MESETSFNISTEVGLTFFVGEAATLQNIGDLKALKAYVLTSSGFLFKQKMYLKKNTLKIDGEWGEKFS